MKKISSILIICFLLSSCKNLEKTFEDEQRNDIPSSFVNSSKGVDTTNKWWVNLPFKGLNEFIESALVENFSIKEAVLLIQQYQFEEKKSKSSKRPSINSSFKGGGYQDETQNSSSNYENYSLSVLASYELDIWNKLEAKLKSSKIDTLAVRKQYEVVSMTIIAKIVELWINIVSEIEIQARLVILNELNESLLELTKLKYQNGQSVLSDYLDQDGIVLNSKSDLTLSEKRVANFVSELLLLGSKSYDKSFMPPACSIENFPLFPNVGIPANLVEQRPDVLKAYLEYQSFIKKHYYIKSSILPSISLDASIMFSAATISGIFDNWLSSIVGSIITVITDGGYKRNELKRMEAAIKQKIFNYKKLVLRAISEVETAIINENMQTKYISMLEKQRDDLILKVKNVMIKYKNGMIEYSKVAATLKNLVSMEINLINKKRDRWIYRINLHRALGGSWLGDNKKISLEDSI